ncbi:2-hydroxycarboxylate transporter family protein [Lentibacillus sp. N15]|uniref:2-hydroxycarboxylate transporter family protein n=1 Tax=Lentibacillus songyuanensis TaxID=3136161 RepID=UPI0031BA6E0A
MGTSNKQLIVGMRPSVFAMVFVVLFLGLYLDVLPHDMLVGFVITMVFGGLLAWIGDNIPGLRTFGGSAILCVLVPPILIYYNIFPKNGVDLVENFFGDQGFINFLVPAFIVGSLLSMDRTFLIKAGSRFIIPVLGGLIFAFIIGGLIANLLGYGFKEAILYIIAPIMGGGISAGAIPMSEIYASNMEVDSSEAISLIVPAVMVGNIICIFIAAILSGLGKKNKDLFKGFSGNGEMLRSKNVELAEEKEVNSATFLNLGVGLVLSGSIYIFGNIIGLLTPSIHPYAWMIITAALLKILNVLPSSAEKAAVEWNGFITKTMIPAILVAVSIALIKIEELIGALSDPSYVIIVIVTVALASLGAGIFGLLASMYYVESSITAGLCMADLGGSGDVAVLGASERMNLMAFAQMSSRLGGALILIIMSFLAPLLL